MKFSHIFALGLLLLAACQGGGGFQTSKSGIEYKFFVRNESKPKIKANDVVDYHAIGKNHKDSVFVDTYKAQGGMPSRLTMPVDSLIPKEDVLKLFFLFSEGDSLQIRIKTDTIYAQNKRQMQQQMDMFKKQYEAQANDKSVKDSLKMQMKQMYDMRMKAMQDQMKNLEKELPKGKYITYNIKILKVRDAATAQKDMEAEQKKMKEKMAEDAKKQLVKDKEVIAKYIKDQKLDAKSTESGLHYVMTTEGTGDSPKDGDEVTVHYIGRLLDGKLFDTSRKGVSDDKNASGRSGDPFKFVIGRGMVIPGWDEGLKLFKKGGKGTLIIPSTLAYGAMGAGGGAIPANAVLLFEIELLNFGKAPEQPQPQVEAPKK